MHTPGLSLQALAKRGHSVASIATTISAASTAVATSTVATTAAVGVSVATAIAAAAATREMLAVVLEVEW